MTSDEFKELSDVMGALAPMLRQTIEIGVLAALRQHSAEQAVECAPAQISLSTAFLDEQMSKVGARMVEGCDLRQGISKPTDEEMLALTGEFDGNKWAEMFVRCKPPTDKDTMRGWFANAIMAGYDHAKREDRKKLKSMQDCLNIQGSSGNWNVNEYMLGMFNGMEHMMAIAEDREPQFRTWREVESVAEKTAEVGGERVVWAQAFQSAYSFCWDPTADQQFITQKASERADMAVAEFRARYK